MISYYQGKENVDPDTFFRRYALNTALTSKLLGFEHLKELYATDFDFSDIYATCEHGTFNKFHRHTGFLFHGNSICALVCSSRELLVRESYSGCLMGDFGVHKTLDVLSEHFYWPHTQKDIEKIYAKCIACKQAKHMFCIHLCLFLHIHGLIHLWILCLVCLELGK